jgi:cell division protein FtsB
MVLEQIPAPPLGSGYAAELLAALCLLLLGGFIYGLKYIRDLYADQLAELRKEKAERDAADKLERAALAAKWDAAEAKRDASRDRLFTELKDSTAEITDHYDGEIRQLRIEIEAKGAKIEDLVSRVGRLEINKKTP